MHSDHRISFISLLLFVTVGAYRDQRYKLNTRYAGADFFKGWDFFTVMFKITADQKLELTQIHRARILLMVTSRTSHPAPNSECLLTRHIRYVNETAAEASHLIIANGYGPTYMGVEHSVALDPAGPGRKSVRISSQKSWTHGLFLADISHMPGGICGTWPACKSETMGWKRVTYDS